jgi:hypothetical protein
MTNKILGISGFIGGGKDTVANYLTTTHQFKKLSFAAPLKDAVAAVFNWERELLEGSTKSSREWRERVDPWWSERLGIPDLTPRYILQQWGTDVLRGHFHNDIWVASIENQLRQATDNIVISDVRFPNEVEAIRRCGGQVIRVTRGPDPEWYEAAYSYNQGQRANLAWATSKRKLDSLNIHPSEYSLVGTQFDHQLDNNHAIDALYHNIDGLLNRMDANK